ncbi:hypothetical protein A3K55_01755 [Candidatus Shapirobacteria bacterium RBG_13_44_7]|uniref:tRNA-dihydrouridine synthase n=1 Tax=Candidatus Shapirobacteria bacterium RBG_13_44_7 TaxID=1802149 RepID=A0A1F7SFY6_9BACT|nr:MAG: hypothetical protein A3K55_01755 [Candidatus Shapirobacteria bacterium RBG_13_44_7]
MHFRSFAKTNLLIGLSPMDGITDEAFRLTQVHIAKPDVLFTEFVNAEGLAHGGLKLFDNLLYSPEERPIIAQLFGKNPDSFYTAAIILCLLGFDGIDINFGCPARTVTQHGSGAALIDQPALASEIITAVQSAVNDFATAKVKISQLGLKPKILEIISRQSLPTNSPPTISAKTRLGINQSVINTWIPHLLKHHLDIITLHGRTLKQAYAGTADWSEIQKAAQIASGSGTLIWGNGDIQTRGQGIESCQKYNLNGVLIGRAALGNPWAFADHLPTRQERFDAALYHFQIFLKTFPHRRTDPLRRHLLAYVSGLPHASNLRSQLVRVNNLEDLLILEKEILQE